MARLEPVDWSRPWLAGWREAGVALEAQVRRDGLVAALNAAAGGRIALRSGCLRFVDQGVLPAGEAYEAFIDRTACVPTRANLHDFFNGLAWLRHPALKRRLNELQAERLAAGGLGPTRGAVRDALTLFDENAALLQAPPVLVEALRARDWHALFVVHRAAWADARLELFGHALIEKLNRPRKPITAHVWVLPREPADATCAAARLARELAAPHLVGRPFLALPVLGVPGWWAGNEAPGFYRDATVFRPARNADSGPRAAVFEPGQPGTPAPESAITSSGLPSLRPPGSSGRP